MNKKLIYLSVFLVLALFLVSSCNEAVGRRLPYIKKPIQTYKTPIVEPNVTNYTQPSYNFTNQTYPLYNRTNKTTSGSGGYGVKSKYS